MKKWIIKKLIGNMPYMANVTVYSGNIAHSIELNNVQKPPRNGPVEVATIEPKVN